MVFLENPPEETLTTGACGETPGLIHSNRRFIFFSEYLKPVLRAF
jgi:hypothetical protein